MTHRSAFQPAWPGDLAPPLDPARLAEPHILQPEWTLLRHGAVRDHAVVVEGGRFTAVGPVDDVAAQFPSLKRLSLPGMLLMPGMIDTHHHLTQSFGKSLVFGEPSEIFRRVWVPLEGSLNAEHLYLSSKLAALEALRGGFTTVVDAGTRSDAGLDAIARAVSDAGVRCVLGLICNDRPGAETLDAAPIQRRASEHLGRYDHHALVTPSLAISIPEVASDAMLHYVHRMCAEAGRIFQTHANEHLVAVERSLNACGRRPIEHLAAVGALGPAALLAHATLVTPHEIRLLADTGAAVAYNPVASAWKGNAVAPAETMATFGVRLGLGTDGTRSDGFRLLDYAEAAQRFAFGIGVGDSSCGAGWRWLDMATHDAADVAGLGAVTGEIAAGKRADFLLVDLDVPELTPSWDVTWELVRLANRDQIRAVFVDGKLRLWEGWPPDWDARALMRDIRAMAADTIAGAPIRKLHDYADAHRARHAQTVPHAGTPGA
ncbi:MULTISPECIES: amidohydrolase family protein [Cupriavidus]|uniref:Amidohydrolase n=1 Tax=Cupriavidus pinatubonensis (strain JMP 134 / LMG 1197) TaxID=264198 RepID=Q46SK4_CUPPJ|nr:MULTISPECIES: amidohydrolase family protein [Cupriavidus]QYY28425.1 amidohydrolase family protein [Cupriavidus pinatubonensis]TPQ36382.1 S-adenosylhomocysteine deaminase [Cupriavidus pinatubonensis]